MVSNGWVQTSSACSCFEGRQSEELVIIEGVHILSLSLLAYIQNPVRVTQVCPLASSHLDAAL